MAVPKKRTSISKKKIRKNFWKKKGYKAALKAFSLAQSIIITGNSRSFYCEKKDNISDN
uniref:Large ribosomal subunit protein bL32c n=1 Tax=Vicia villosa TaxID=3911 RepID=A0A0X8GHE8_VICVI|nr:ribosomal protein L32 [Vicia villosa]